MELANQLGERIRICDLLLVQGRIARTGPYRRRSSGNARIARGSAAQQALGFELAALVAMCELDDAPAEDRDALGAVCGRLTEGFDIPLVKSAQALAGCNPQ